MTSANATATPTDQAQAPHLAVAPLRSAFSLTHSESLIAFVAASCVWLLLYRFPVTSYGTAALPFWTPLTFCNILALSAVCAWRFLRREETLAISRLGYASLAFPAVQAFLYALIVGVFPSNSNSIGLVLRIALALCFFAHVFFSSVATMRGLRRAEVWFDVTAFPLWLGWMGVMAAFDVGSAPSP